MSKGACRTRVRKETMPMSPKSNVFSSLKTSSRGQPVQRSLGRRSCAAFMLVLLFLWAGVHVLTRLFLPPGGPSSAHKHHCLQGVLTAGQESLWSAGSTLPALPRRPIHPHRLGSTHTLSVSQKTLSVVAQQRRQCVCVGGGSVMSWIKFPLAI